MSILFLQKIKIIYFGIIFFNALVKFIEFQYNGIEKMRGATH